MATKPSTKTTLKRRGAKGSPPKRSGALGKSSSSKKAEEYTEDDLKKLVPKGLAHTFVQSKLHEAALSVAGLGEVAEWDGDMPELPDDIAAEDHDTLSNLLAQFTNAYSTAIWFSSKNYVESDAYEEIAEYLEAVALIDAEGPNEPARKAAAKTDERVVTARALHKTAYHNYVRFRDLARTLDARAKAVSRIGGFVGDEAEHEETKALKSSTRGKGAGGSRGRSRGSTKLKPRK